MIICFNVWFQHTLRTFTKIWSKILKNSSEMIVKLCDLCKKEILNQSNVEEKSILSLEFKLEKYFDQKSKCIYIIF